MPRGPTCQQRASSDSTSEVPGSSARSLRRRERRVADKCAFDFAPFRAWRAIVGVEPRRPAASERRLERPLAVPSSLRSSRPALRLAIYAGNAVNHSTTSLDLATRNAMPGLPCIAVRASLLLVVPSFYSRYCAAGDDFVGKGIVSEFFGSSSRFGRNHAILWVSPRRSEDDVKAVSFAAASGGWTVAAA